MSSFLFSICCDCPTTVMQSGLKTWSVMCVKCGQVQCSFGSLAEATKEMLEGGARRWAEKMADKGEKK